MKKWNAVFLSMLLACSFLALPVKAAENASSTSVTEEVAASPSVKQLRGKLLYKRNQIRKLERSATGADATLKEKITSLENQIQALYVAADPKLESLYQAEKELLQQIESATPKK